jgi:hypothetical protein
MMRAVDFAHPALPQFADQLIVSQPARQGRFIENFGGNMPEQAEDAILSRRKQLPAFRAGVVLGGWKRHGRGKHEGYKTYTVRTLL